MNYWSKEILLLARYLSKIILISAFLLFLFHPLSAQSQIEKGYEETLRKAHVYADDGKVVITAFKAIRYSDKKYNELFSDIRIYRLPCPKFVFGTDYEEYFYNLDYKKSKQIFQGSLEPILGSKFSFVDETAEKDMVYAYWIGSSAGEPIGPFPVKVRDMDVWWTYEKIRNKIENIKQRYPEYVKIEKIGYSVNRKPMLGMQIGKGKCVLALVGAIHAGESGPELIIPILEQLIIQNADLLKKISIIAIPTINCDHRDKLARGIPWYIRRNANFVDLNRNFPAEWKEVEITYGYKTTDPDGLTYRGPFAGSEPETQAVMDFLKTHKPNVVFSFHALASIAGETLFASSGAIKDKEYVDQCYNVARQYWGGIDSLLLKNKKIGFICNNGSLPTWCYKELGIPAFDLESPVNSNDKDKLKVDKTDLTLLKKYQERNLKGFVRLLNSLSDTYEKSN